MTPKRYELTGVSEERLPDVARNFHLDGATSVEIEPEPSGFWTVRANYLSTPRSLVGTGRVAR